MNLERKEIEKAVSEMDLENIYYPKSLDRIVGKNGEEIFLRQENNFEEWIEKAEKWDEAPRKTGWIEDYRTLEEELEDMLNQEAKKDRDYPGLEGAEFAEEMIEVGKRSVGGNSLGGFMIGFDLPELEEKENQTQVLAPQGTDSVIDAPEWLNHDDWYSEVEGGEYVAVITDDPTAFARYVQDNYQKEGNFIQSFDDRFWKGYEETLDSYTGLE